MIALIAAAMAGEAAYYHPDDVAKASALFGKVAESMGPAFEERQGKIEGVGEALAQLELGVGLLGKAAPAELRAWSESTRRKIVGEKLRLQKHVDLLQDDYGRVFGDALKRALPTVSKGYTVTECGATGVYAMMGKTNCKGVNLNPPLAAALDADAGLQKELASIASVEWPSFDVPSQPQSVVALTGTTRWVQGGALAQAFLAAPIKARQDTLEAALDKLAPDELGAADLNAALALKQTYLDGLGTDGEAFRAALSSALGRAKKTAPAEVGWCANPVALGGCPGEDVTAQVKSLLEGDKRFAKDIAAIGG